MNYEQYWIQAISSRKKADLLRATTVVDSAQGRKITIGDHTYINFSSNDYLGLAADLRIKRAFQQGADRWGVGAGASHLVSGHTRAHEILEQKLSRLTGRPRALLYSTGYMANIGVISTLLDRHSWVAADKLNHASLIDAVLLSRAKSLRYRHRDVKHLSQQLESVDSSTGMIVTDAVFSMDGDIAPITELADVARAHDALLMVDDAHGFGVLGDKGAGTVALLGVNETVPVYMATFGKALGVFGAFVAGSESLIDYLMQFSRSYTYTTAMPAANACAVTKALDIIEQEPWRRKKVLSLAQQFRHEACREGFTLIPSDTAIQSLVLGDPKVALEYSAQLKSFGFWVPAIRPPTVPANSARLRFSFSAGHEAEDVEQLVEKLVYLKGQLKHHAQASDLSMNLGG